MRAVVQRVREASVAVDDRPVGRTGSGLLIYLGVGADDSDEDLEYLAQKVSGLRIFPDASGNMNRSAIDEGKTALVISQFTLYGDVRRGKRPSFSRSMAPPDAERIFDRFVERLTALGVPCQKGVFGAMMHVSSINDGPVTILLDSSKLF